MSAVDEALTALSHAICQRLSADMASCVADSMRPIAVSVPKAAKLVHRGRKTITDAIAAGELLAMTGDGETAVIVSDLERWATERAKRSRRLRAVG